MPQVKYNFKGIGELGELQKDEMTGMLDWLVEPQTSRADEKMSSVLYRKSWSWDQ